jgi:hypothetical protein
MNNSKRNTKNNKNKKLRKGGNNGTLKQMNCSPAVKDKAPIKGSCFTADALQILKTSYNKHNKENPIINTHPRDIWKELKGRLSTCNKEDCWLSEIDDPKIRIKLDKYMFAPDQPVEWKKNSHEWLSNFDISDVLKQYQDKYKNFHYTDPSPIDYDNKPADMKDSCVSNELCTFNLEKYYKDGKTK